MCHDSKKDEIREKPGQTFLFSESARSSSSSSSSSTVAGAAGSGGADISADGEEKEAAASDSSLSCACQKKTKITENSFIHPLYLKPPIKSNHIKLPTKTDQLML